jgi:hypothetical protein
MSFGKKESSVTVVKEANIVRTTIEISGTAPFVQHKFSKKAREAMECIVTQTAADKSKKKREPRNFADDFIQSQHISSDGWVGIPCPAFRAAMIDACRAANVVMTRAKMSVFVLPDGFDADDGTPLVRIYSKKKPEKHTGLVRLENGSADIRVRAMWREWSAKVTLEFDADMISADSVVNLLDRAGRQVGVGEGRPFSKNSCGQGWGTFQVVTRIEDKKHAKAAA